LNFFFI